MADNDDPALRLQLRMMTRRYAGDDTTSELENATYALIQAINRLSGNAHHDGKECLHVAEADFADVQHALLKFCGP